MSKSRTAVVAAFLGAAIIASGLALSLPPESKALASPEIKSMAEAVVIVEPQPVVVEAAPVVAEAPVETVVVAPEPEPVRPEPMSLPSGSPVPQIGSEWVTSACISSTGTTLADGSYVCL